MSKEPKTDPGNNREQIIRELSDLLTGIGLVARSIGRMMKAVIEKGEETDEEEGHVNPD